MWKSSYGRRNAYRPPEIPIPSRAGHPLSMNLLPLCHNCGWAEMRTKERLCRECLESKKRPICSKDVRDALWLRDKGVCGICGLDTVELGDRARIAFMGNDEKPNKAAASAIYAAAGFKNEDKGLSLWFPLIIQKGLAATPVNHRTACRPCYRAAAARQAELAPRKRRQDMTAQPGLFGSEDEHRSLSADSGYSSS